ncbi:hypothetical protein AMES_6110 [Amycolatopsis mediterranei S699]|uniref:Secreted protein n=2 Tax=Amycolatopsis mediterranei TaxID=33910 RepID=A0A0H3DAA0_AMYMU|nr:DUF6454 family protein [Amycolatopsis mediterranei]ADJ47935.1 conserved hypothetical protein [Amycolatopsis mediterranei U32]AEK44835.1 hypothetical protein RAM_31810 [Amycolatopsis mediterranei S699]AFO79646.1 hypothetical protein AMES_6110 [Amycolatopsis mediterranei S699]AGT86774.1 hypothetical protein B737_6110 [Amycolatopsis mediterranei RB]KDO10756.1 hypothetical protein DV26_11060 [Amycolatopsis mediterranei]
MKTVDLRRALLTIVALVVAVGGAATASASTTPAMTNAGAVRKDAVSADFAAVTRDTRWELVSTLKLQFPTYHTEGLAFAGDRMFLSAVQVLEPTKKYPVPQGGYDRTPGKGIGHVFVMDRAGHLQRDIVLGEGDMYHPAGMDFDGTSVWVPVAQYRPDSSAVVYRIDARTLAVHKQFEVADHVGGIVRDAASGHLVGQSWGSRRFYEWTTDGRRIAAWDNPGFFVDYQDCQTLPQRRMICGGIANLPQTPAAGGAGATYELGGIGLVDLRARQIEHEAPVQLWSAAGHVVNRNPFKIAAAGNTLTMWVAPDNGDEGNGTELLTYATTVAPPR